MKTLQIAIAMACIITISAFASDAATGYKKIAGSYAISSRNLIDPAPGEKKDRAVFFLEGDAAMDMYNKMSVAAKEDPCSEDLITKSSGGLICSKEISTNVYTCTFGVLLKSGTLVKASVC